MGVGNSRGVFQLALRRTGLTEPQIVLDRAVKQIGVLVHDGEPAADLIEAERAQIALADPNHAFLRVVVAQQQSDDGGLAYATWADDANPLSGLDTKAQALMRGLATARIGKRNRLERDRCRRFIQSGRGGRGVANRGCRIEDREHALRGRLADHPLVEKCAKLPQGPKNLDPHHQDDQQGLDAHGTRRHPVGPYPECRRGADRDSGIRDAARQGVGRKHPHGALEQRLGLLRQQPGAGAALAERLQRGEPLNRIQELGAETAEGSFPRPAGAAVPALECHRQNQRNQGEPQQHRGDRQVEKGDEGKNSERHQERHHNLRQITPEVGFQLFHPVDDGEDHLAGTLPPEMGRSQFHHLVVKQFANVDLNQRRRAVGRHIARIFKIAARQHDGGDDGKRHDEGFQRLRPEHLGKQPAEQRQSGDAEDCRQQADRDGGGNAKTNAPGEFPQPRIEIHFLSRSPNLSNRLALLRAQSRVRRKS